MPTPRKSSGKKGSASKAAASKSKPKRAAKEKPSKAKAAAKSPKAKPVAKSGRPEPAVMRSHATPTSGLFRPEAPRVRRKETRAPEPLDASSGPAKPQVDTAWQQNIRDAMVHQRQQLLSVVQSTQAQMAEKSGDLADVSDRASEAFEDELDMGLMAIEAAQLDDIDAAIQRIDDGSYGICEDCGRAIPRKRLEVLPFARRCLGCAGVSEKRGRLAEPETEEEDWD